MATTNAGLKRYQAMTKAATAVAEGKPGAKLKLKTATKTYLDAVAKSAKKMADEKIAEAKKKAAKVSGLTKKRKPAPAKKKAAPKRKSTRTTARKRK